MGTNRTLRSKLPGRHSKRTSVAVTSDVVDKAFSRLPLTLSTKNVMIPYSCKNFKKSPRWAEINKIRDTIKTLINATDGKNILHVSMAAGVVAYSVKHMLNYDEAACDVAAYTCRAMIGQLLNHNKKGHLCALTFFPPPPKKNK